jgi:hypothetical protein
MLKDTVNNLFVVTVSYEKYIINIYYNNNNYIQKMEFAIPLLAMGGLYVVSNQSKKKLEDGCASKENFQTANKRPNGWGVNNTSDLPNSNVPDRNYPDDYLSMNPVKDRTSKISTVNRYDGGSAYTDKYFNPEKNVDVVNTYAPMGGNSVDSNASTYKSLSGETVNKDYFQHNNMVPFFGGNIRSRNVEANSNESVLDNYLGTGSQTIIKKEQAPLFSPGENYQWANGAPNTTDFMRSRVNPSMRMANVKPFEEEQVGPGIGLGYDNNGQGGFNSGMLARDLWTEKNVDQLRVLTNPKAGGNMILGYEGPAIHAVTNRAELGIQEKHRPDTTFEFGQERYFTTTGRGQGNSIRPEQIDRYTTRQDTSTSYSGAAKSYQNLNKSTVDGLDSEHMPTHRIQLGTQPIGTAGATGKGGASTYDFGANSAYAYPNQRSTTRKDDYFGAIGGAFGAAVAPLLDALRPSRKENTIGSLRPYQNPKSRVEASYMFDPNDRPAPTIRDTTRRDGIYANINAGQRGGAYDVTPQYLDPQERDSTNVSYMGVSSAGERYRMPKSYDAINNQRNNDIKSSTIDGRMAPGNMALYNGDITMTGKAKDAWLKNSRPLGPEGPKQSGSLYNFGEIQRQPTMLDQSQQLERNNGDVLTALSGNPYAIPYRSK